MPFLQMETTAGKKRKRTEANGKELIEKNGTSVPQKKSKDIKEHISKLESGIIESQRNYNDIVKLQGIAANEDDSETALLAQLALCRVFGTLMAGGSLNKSKSSAESELVIVQWLKDRYSEYQDTLLSLLRHGTLHERKVALELMMRLVKEESTHLKPQRDAIWRSGIFAQIVQQAAESPPEDNNIRTEIEKCLKEFDDIRYWTLGAVE